ncbi:hypothetical protein JTE90_025292 [Oedothorax gibbosus]|uniref:Transposable element P transposase-like RNase H domain-containing protein n=1 Tax=Oedothorax gibbosus TaxID=931172 RepID=A0AAV6TPE9_9ARAC|nr:hypothetical protein JTE90_025292 [Oedothorax gibbosus]
MSLPHPAMLRTWVSTANCFPGFLDESHAYIKSIAEQQETALDCALIIDSMSIRKQILWDKSRSKYAGYVECAGIVEGSEPSVASEALVFLLVSMSMKFKVPIAYFFVDKINSAVLSQLINVCLTITFKMSERHKRRKTKALVDKHMLDLQEASEPSTESSSHE